jgi:type II secretory pathway pseudopilin PulG
MNKKGFTLVEVLVFITIFLLVSIGIFNILSFSQNFYSQKTVQSELLQNGRVILERITREIRQGEAMVSQLPQVPSNLENPPLLEIEFQDGHTPSPYEYLGSDYYYIRYYFSSSTKELYRQYKIYCFDPCESCSTYFRWDDTKIEGTDTISTHACVLEEKIIGEYVEDLNFWGSGLVNVSLSLQNKKQELNFQTKIFGRNF